MNMATPINAPYKLAQQAARSSSMKRMLFVSTYGIGGNPKTAKAMRDGKLNKKHGRRLTTAYI